MASLTRDEVFHNVFLITIIKELSKVPLEKHIKIVANQLIYIFLESLSL